MPEYLLHINQQLASLRRQGLSIRDTHAAKEALLDIGFYRLSFYLYPFQNASLPERYRQGRDGFPQGAYFEDAVSLYQLDLHLRSLLLHYTLRLEVNFRTSLIYYGSLRYSGDDCWFANASNVTAEYLRRFERVVYTNAFRRNPVIADHHRKNRRDRFAPAWKTIELMTMGEVLTLYRSLLDQNLKQEISRNFAIPSVPTFENYMDVVRQLRNSCAHTGTIFDFSPTSTICKGPAQLASADEHRNLMGLVRVMSYLLRHISIGTSRRFLHDLQSLLDQFTPSPVIAYILSRYSGLPARLPRSLFR